MWTKVIAKFRAGGIPAVRKAVVSKLFNYPPVPSTHPIQVALDVVTKEEGFTIIQVGAFVGNTDNDPLFSKLSERLRERNGKLIVVEPAKQFFDLLAANYEGVPGVSCENVAISNNSGPATFYRLGVDPVAYGYPDWLSQLGSLKQERMEELWDRYESDPRLKEFYLEHRVQETVDCISFDELAARHSLSQLDLLQIDVEGFEYEILTTIDFRTFPIRFVNYERVLLQDSLYATERLMRRYGYRLVDYEQDTFCYTKRDRHLARQWR